MKKFISQKYVMPYRKTKEKKNDANAFILLKVSTVSWSVAEARATC